MQDRANREICRGEGGRTTGNTDQPPVIGPPVCQCIVPIWKLAEINGVRCLTMMNGMMERLSNRKWRELLGRYIFGQKTIEE